MEAIFQLLRITFRVNSRPLRPHVLKSSLGRKNDRCPDLNEIVDQNTNHEFPDKIVAI